MPEETVKFLVDFADFGYWLLAIGYFFHSPTNVPPMNAQTETSQTPNIASLSSLSGLSPANQLLPPPPIKIKPTPT